MGIEGTEKMADWGKKIPVNENQHVSQTNADSKDGCAAHITTEIPGMKIKVHDRLDSGGNYTGSNFAKK